MGSLFAIFLSVFLAELGDKTQLATLLFAATSPKSPWLIFAAASSALVTSTALACLVGQAAHQHLAAMPVKLIAGIGFVLIGGWMIAAHFRGA